MTSYYKTWELSRGRFDSAIEEFTDAGLNFRLQPGNLTAGEAAIHVAGVELWFASQLLGLEFPEYAAVMKSATEGVVNDGDFPIPSSQITKAFVKQTLDYARSVVSPVLMEPSLEVLHKEIKSALGPIITGEGALIRWGFHPAYHHGQVYMILQSSDCPK